jgi:membrane protein YqaA with SNARE-associated domain
MLRSLYDRMIRLAESRHAPWALAGVSFAESSFFPSPPDVMLVPMALARPERAWFYAGLCTVASVIGGIAGYMIGWLLFDTVGTWIISLYGYGEKVNDFRALYNEWGAAIILIKGVTPIPYKIVTIASGIAGYSLFWFIMLSVITRGIRFFLVAGILNHFGDGLRHLIERHLTAAAIILVVSIIGGFALVKLFL